MAVRVSAGVRRRCGHWRRGDDGLLIFPTLKLRWILRPLDHDPVIPIFFFQPVMVICILHPGNVCLWPLFRELRRWCSKTVMQEMYAERDKGRVGAAGGFARC